MGSEKYKISFCIVCMNRLHQLKETLLQNITDNVDYDELEFVVLDYNSEDGMEEWIKTNLSGYIESGKVVHYRTDEPQLFSHSHSKNMAFKLAIGDIVCNINADHYTGPGFATYINAVFSKKENIVLTPIDYYKTKKDYHPPRDVLGRVCVRKSDFLRIKGFDERMIKYGFEDCDFINRLEMLNVERVLIEDFSYLRFISHSEDERFVINADNIHSLYVNYRIPSVSEIFLLYNDQRFEKGELIDNSIAGSENHIYAYKQKYFQFEYTVNGLGWMNGTWKDTEIGDLKFSFNQGADLIYHKRKKNHQQLTMQGPDNQVFYLISDPEVINNLLNFNFFFINRSMMEKTLEQKRSVVNHDDFGKATVFKNFKSDKPILI